MRPAKAESHPNRRAEMNRYRMRAQAFVGSHQIEKVIEAANEAEALKIASRELDENGNYYLISIKQER
jgi:hypothetical protein